MKKGNAFTLRYKYSQVRVQYTARLLLQEKLCSERNILRREVVHLRRGLKNPIHSCKLYFRNPSLPVSTGSSIGPPPVIATPTGRTRHVTRAGHVPLHMDLHQDTVVLFDRRCVTERNTAGNRTACIEADPEVFDLVPHEYQFSSLTTANIDTYIGRARVFRTNPALESATIHDEGSRRRNR